MCSADKLDIPRRERTIVYIQIHQIKRLQPERPSVSSSEHHWTTELKIIDHGDIPTAAKTGVSKLCQKGSDK